MSSIYSSDKILTGPHSTSLGGNTKDYESSGGKKSRKQRRTRNLKKKRISRKKKCRFFFFYTFSHLKRPF